MKKILVLEDNYYSAESIREILDGLSYDSDFASNVAAARDCWEENKGAYDCIVLDMMVNPLGLTPEEVDAYPGFFGWAWLRNYVLAPNQENEKEIKSKTIVYSKFADDFSAKWRREKGEIKVISKRDQKALEELKQSIAKICK